MQCTQCGAAMRSGLAECPQCGARVTFADGANMYQPGPGASYGYVPGGGAAPQQPVAAEPFDVPPGGRPLGSLQRRLQLSQVSIPDDEFEDDGGRNARSPGRGGQRGQRPRPLDGPRPPRSSGPRGGDPYADQSSGRDRRPPSRQDAPRHDSRGAERSRAGYDDLDASRDESAYLPRSGYAPDDSRAYPAARSGGRGRPPQRNTRDPYGPPDDSMELSAEAPVYDPPRRGTRPGSRPGSRPGDRSRDAWEGYPAPRDDDRGSSRSGQGRRPSQQGGRAYDDYGAPPPRRPSRNPAPYEAGYTDGDLGSLPGYSEERPAYNARTGPSRSDGRQTGRDSRGGRSGAYLPPSNGYTDFNAPVASDGWGESDVFPGLSGEMGAWQPARVSQRPGASGAASSRAGRGSTGQAAPKKRGSNVFSTIFWLFVLLVMVAGAGVEFGPQVYHLVTKHSLGSSSGATGSQTPLSCATEATPAAQATVASGSTAFATSAYSLVYPSGWQKSLQSGSSGGQCDVAFQFSQPNGTARITVEQAGAFGALTDLQVIQAEAQSAAAQGTSFSEITSSASTQSLGGEVWQRHEYQVTIQSGLKLHLALLATHHKGVGYAIILLSSDSGFASDDMTSFEPLLHSFQFVG